MKVFMIVAVVIAAAIAINSGLGSSKSGAADSQTASSNISVVPTGSFCLRSGVDDVYTGDGDVFFVFTLRNTGETGTVNVTPVRHYSDGETNASALDMLDGLTVPGHSTKRFKTGLYKYKAHSHDIVGCGLELDGDSETSIDSRHI